MNIAGAVKLARPEHWIKNAVVVLPVLFGMKMGAPAAWGMALLAAAAFCMVSSFTYILNDMKDAPSDRCHPKKKNRPLAAGTVTLRAALVEAVIFLCLGAFIAAAVSRLFFIVAGLYVVLQLAYTFKLKHKVLVDVICIALGFVLRTIGGAVAIGVEVSPWLFVCMFTLCLFMGFCKRYSEIVTLNDTVLAENHRPTLISYSKELLGHLITVSAGIAVIAFLLYALNERTVEHFGSNYFVYTLPVVIYAVFRFAMLSMRATYDDPVELMLKDRLFQLTAILWISLVLVIINYSKQITDYINSLR